MPSCSQIKLGLDWIDTIIAWQLDKEFDLTVGQEKILDKEIDSFFKAKKQSYTLRIGKELESIAADYWKNKDNKAELNKLIDNKIATGTELISSLAVDVLPYLLKSAKQLKKENWEHYRESFINKTKERRLQKSAMVERYNDWMPLKDTQKRIVQQFLKDNPFDWDMWEKNRKDAFSSFELKFYKTGEFNVDLFAQSLEQLFKEPNLYQNKTYVAYINDRRDKMKDLTLTVLLSLELDQQTKLHKLLLERSRQFIAYSESHKK